MPRYIQPLGGHRLRWCIVFLQFTSFKVVKIMYEIIVNEIDLNL